MLSTEAIVKCKLWRQTGAINNIRSYHMYPIRKFSNNQLCCQKYASHGKKLKIKFVRNRISSKKVLERICHLSSDWSCGARKMGMFEVLFCRKTANYIHLRPQRCQKYVSHGKKLEIKVVWNRISSKKVLELILVDYSCYGIVNRYPAFSSLIKNLAKLYKILRVYLREVRMPTISHQRTRDQVSFFF